MRLKARKRALDELETTARELGLDVAYVPLCGVSDRPLTIQCPMCGLVMSYNGTKYFCPDCGILEHYLG
jgi:transposase